MTNLLADRYELRSRIARGGMAEVYRAVDTRLDRVVAVKVLSATHAAEASFVDRFRREAQSAAALSHPNIVTIFDWGQAERTPFIVMEYVDGRTLKEVLTEHGPLPEHQALDLAAQIAAALAAAHQNGIVHRDIKPQNVLLDRQGRAKVADFGIARVISSQMTETTAVLGSVHYLSPEQARKEKVDGRADIYSLGVVLYEMLTGRVPFEADSAVGVALQHLSDPPTLPSQVRPSVSPAAEAIVLKALRKDPEDRFQTAAQMQAALAHARAAALGRSAGSVPASTQRYRPQAGVANPTRTAGPAGRHGHSGAHRQRALWMLAGPLAFLLLLGVLFTLGELDEEGDSTAQPAPAPEVQGARATGVPATPTTVAAAAEESQAQASATFSPSEPTPTASGAAVEPTSEPPAPTAQPLAKMPEVRTTQEPEPVPDAEARQEPAATVMGFYQALEQGNFDEAAAHWTPSMRQRFPPSVHIDQRFAGTTSLDILRAEPIQVDEAAGRATVAVELVEHSTTEGTRRWVGTWQLLRVDGQWLLDAPNLQPA